jgi:hypothetical protein
VCVQRVDVRAQLARVRTVPVRVFRMLFEISVLAQQVRLFFLQATVFGVERTPRIGHRFL